MSFVDPRSDVGDDVLSYDDLSRRPIPRRPTIGLLANGFPDSAAFLDALADELTTMIDGISFERVTKVSPPTPLTDAQLGLLTTSCHAVVAAYGH